MNSYIFLISKGFLAKKVRLIGDKHEKTFLEMGAVRKGYYFKLDGSPLDVLDLLSFKYGYMVVSAHSTGQRATPDIIWTLRRTFA